MADLKEAAKSDIRDYFFCCPLCRSKKLVVHLEGSKPNIRHFVVNKRFFKDLKDEEKPKEFFREVFDRPNAKPKSGTSLKSSKTTAGSQELKQKSYT